MTSSLRFYTLVEGTKPQWEQICPLLRSAIAVTPTVYLIQTRASATSEAIRPAWPLPAPANFTHGQEGQGMDAGRQWIWGVRIVKFGLWGGRCCFSQEKQKKTTQKTGIVFPGARGRRKAEWMRVEWTKIWKGAGRRGGGHSRPNGPPAGHSVIHKMRWFSQTTLYHLPLCGSYTQLGHESSVLSAFW